MTRGLSCLLALLAVLVVVGGARAQVEPADERIRAVYIDLKRYEAQVRKLTPDRGSQVARLRKLLNLSRQRLDSSSNRGHASWQYADAGLARLFAALSELEQGRRPNLDAPIAAAPSSPPAPAQVRSEPVAPAAPLAPAPALTPTAPALAATATPAAQPVADTALPVIVADVPRIVPVGEKFRLTGRVGDDASPPRLKVDGAPATLFRLRADETPVAAHSLAFRIDVPTDQAGERTLVLEACDAAGNCVGKEVSLRIGTPAAPKLAGRNIALVIGNDDYRHMPALGTAIGDARAVAKTLVDHYAFAADDVRLLLNADRRTILGAMEALRDELDVEDRLLVYYAGHGQVDRHTGEGFWLPVDAEPDKTYTWVANDDIRRQLRALPVKHVLVVADSCFSGSLTRSAPARPDVPQDRFIEEVDSHLSRKVITSGGIQPVADSGLDGHSIFAYYFLKTLRENDSDYLTSFELYNRFVRAVTNNSDQKPHFGTIAKAGDEGFGDFTFIRR